MFGVAHDFSHLLVHRRSGDVRENGGGGGGGFSFPITPPSDEPDQRLFTSWPSVRSSCTSEPIAIDDDDNALPAEYADDGGRAACY